MPIRKKIYDWEMSEEYRTEIWGETTVEEEETIDKPKRYKVIIHNDDYTPMDFVVEILMEIFNKDETAATQIMLNVHHRGKGVCGVYSYEVAETKVARVHQRAVKCGYPLKASMEVE